MTVIKQILRLLVLLLASIGVVGCIAGVCGAWFFRARLGHTTANIFEKIDASVVSANDKVAKVQQRVKDSNFTAEGIEQSLKDWTRLEARERVATRVHAEEKVKRIAEALDQADQWLENSVSSVELVRQTLEIGNSTGASFDTELVDRLVTEAESLRAQLTEVAELVATMQESTAESQDEKSREARMDQAVRLTLRVIATLGSIDFRLENFQSRLSETRKQLQDLQAGTQRWILAATIAMTLMLVWMAAGQVALFLFARKKLNRMGPL